MLGALLVIASIAWGAISLPSLDQKIAKAQKEISELSERTQRLAQTRLSADEQAAIALNFIALGTDRFNHTSAILQALKKSAPRETLVLGRGITYLNDAIHKMWDATGVTDSVCKSEAGENWKEVVDSSSTVSADIRRLRSNKNKDLGVD